MLLLAPLLLVLLGGVHGLPLPPPLAPSLASITPPHSWSHLPRSSPPPPGFFEGWYYRVTADVATPADPWPSASHTFALIVSCQTLKNGTTVAAIQAAHAVANRVGCEIGTPSYAFAEVSSSPSSPSSPPLRFESSPTSLALSSVLSPTSRFSITPTSLSATLPGNVSFSLSLSPSAGWGAPGAQRSTAGWLSRLPLADPQWQVLAADGRCEGRVTFPPLPPVEFKGARLYEEKNWGRRFPRRWFWMQCNSFPAEAGLTLTVGGGEREIPRLLGGTENLGLIGIHLNSTFYEFAPWSSQLSWEVEWGSWKLWAKNDEGEAVIISARCGQDQGQALQVPMEGGLEWACRDAYCGRVEVSLWDRAGEIVLDKAESTTCGVEIGGGGWAPGESWAAESRMNWLLKFVVKWPGKIGRWAARVRRRATRVLTT
ncbi:hypothetical protein TeGR_g11479 [Tetraparma gracilis]|uniref:Tocopherol cyclase n=1 Tax=Tetraparma gracilis TaxID=2962635 RepID=A0ABQ6N1V3_9STRA|nr:hypothetical protein TeGR_g11479 [Tetraparma gracilis]